MTVVRTLRSRAGITQRELATRAGTSQATIAAYESGRKSPTWRTIAALARAVGLDAEAVFVPPLTREDRRSLALHRAVAAKLAAHPAEVVAAAKRNLARMRTANPGAAPLLDEWDDHLCRPASEIIELLADPGSRARELRHVTPFAGVLTASERTAVYRPFRAEEANREA